MDQALGLGPLDQALGLGPLDQALGLGPLDQALDHSTIGPGTGPFEHWTIRPLDWTSLDIHYTVHGTSVDQHWTSNATPLLTYL